MKRRCIHGDSKGFCNLYFVWCRSYPGCKGHYAESRLPPEQTTLSDTLPILREGSPMGEPGASRRGYTRDRVERVQACMPAVPRERDKGEAGASPSWLL